MEMNLKIPMGYKVYEEEFEIDIQDVEKIFENKVDNYVSEIMRKDENHALIKRHTVKCPHCGKKSGLYFRKIYAEIYDNKSVRKEKIDEWRKSNNKYFMLWETMFFADELKDYSGDFTCTKCGLMSEKTKSFFEINLKTTETTLEIKRELKHIKDITEINWMKEILLVSFPMYERIVFDFENGITRLEIISGENIISKVVTNRNTDITEDSLISLINRNRVLKRLIKRIVEIHTGKKVGIEINELDFQKFVNITYFNGFPVEFYDAIPFREGTNELDGSFEDLASRLRTPEMAMKLLKESTLPDCKSVRKVFTSKSGLFFYIKECEMLYEFFKDINILCRVLKSPYIYSFLVDAHYYNLRVFFEDFARVTNKNKMIWLSENLSNIKNYAVNYNSLSNYGKRIEQQKWISNDKEYLYVDGLLKANLSIPMHPVPENAKLTILGKYTFKWLRTKNDYTNAGEILKNCLVHWWSNDNPVVVVIMDEKIVAALEICDDKIIQARRSRNESIDENSELYKTISAWCELQQIRICIDEYNEWVAPF